MLKCRSAEVLKCWRYRLCPGEVAEKKGAEKSGKRHWREALVLLQSRGRWWWSNSNRQLGGGGRTRALHPCLPLPWVPHPYATSTSWVLPPPTTTMPGSSEDSQLNVQGYNIVTIIKRLEAATSRLEDITIFQEEAHKAQKKLAGAEPAAIVAADTNDQTPEPTPGQTRELSQAPQAAAAAAELPTAAAFDAFVRNYIDPFVAASAALDGVVGEAAALFKDAFAEQAKFLRLVARARKPDAADPKFGECLAPINAKIEALTALKDANRRSEFFNHLNTVAEGAPVLGWIVTDTPVAFIPEFKDSAQFWANRVMKEYKDKDAAHVEWVKLFLAIFDALRAYAKEYHESGLSWNPDGLTLGDALAAASTDSSAGAGAAPPPPPPPPPAPPASLFDEPAAAPAPGGMNAVFADLNKGGDVTSGLRKVDKSEMTHKNPALKAQPAVVKKPTPPKKPTTLSSAAPKRKPARKELVDGSKWIVENFTEADATGPIVIDAEMSQSIFIGNTVGVTVQINGKGNAITITDTKRTGVVVDSLISGVDVIKSLKFGLQVTGVVPLITVDKSDEGSIYLSQASIDADLLVVTSNCTAVNINVPQNDDFTELFVPEQLKHSIKNGKLVSEVVEHVG